MVEGARLESEYTSQAYRGFESLPLRQLTRAKRSHFWRISGAEELDMEADRTGGLDPVHDRGLHHARRRVGGYQHAGGSAARICQDIAELAFFHVN